MSFTVAFVLIAVTDALVVTALAAACGIPFRLDREAAPAPGASRFELDSAEFAAA